MWNMNVQKKCKIKWNVKYIDFIYLYKAAKSLENGNSKQDEQMSVTCIGACVMYKM